MAEWIKRSIEVFGEIECQCSECGWTDWQTPYWWKNDALFCPHCGIGMRFEDQAEEETDDEQRT